MTYLSNETVYSWRQKLTGQSSVLHRQYLERLHQQDLKERVRELQTMQPNPFALATAPTRPPPLIENPKPTPDTGHTLINPAVNLPIPSSGVDPATKNWGWGRGTGATDNWGTHQRYVDDYDQRHFIPPIIKNTLDPQGRITNWVQGPLGPLSSVYIDFTRADSRYTPFVHRTSGVLGFLWDVLVWSGGYVVFTYEDFITEWSSWDGSWMGVLSPYRLWRTIVTAAVSIGLVLSLPFVESLMSITWMVLQGIWLLFQGSVEAGALLNQAVQRAWRDWENKWMRLSRNTSRRIA
jgi:hypothetical protein